MDTTYDVRIWQIETSYGQRVASYRVHWSVAGRKFHQSFQTFGLADGFRAELLSATHHGMPFGQSTGVPERHEPTGETVSWYDFACQFVDARWPNAAGNQRKNVAKTFMATTIALLPSRSAGARPIEVRTALREWAFNTERRRRAPADVVAILDWVARHAPAMNVWEDPAVVDEVLNALTTLLDGRSAAASSVGRHRRILNVAMEYAVERHILTANPLPKGHGRLPPVCVEVDRRCLLNPQQAAGLLGCIRSRPRGGPRLHSFFASLYYTALRPEEAVALNVRDAHLPDENAEDQWGELFIHHAEPEVGRWWTDAGSVHETRHLKGRAEKATRVTPCHPALTRILREHIRAERLQPGDRLFQGERGGTLAGSVYHRAWSTARRQALPPDVYASPTGRRVYDLRHTCLTTWLNNGIPPAQAAEWAGTSVAMLLATYARCICGQTTELERRIEAAQDISRLYGEEAA